MFKSILARSSLPAVASTRTFTTSLAARKSLTDTVKETAENINKKVGETLASGIGAAQEAGNTASAQASEKTANAASNAATAGQALKEDLNRKVAQGVQEARVVKDDIARS